MFTKKDFDWNMKSIDDDVKNGTITREQANKSINSIKQAYKTGENERLAKKVEDIRKRNKK